MIGLGDRMTSPPPIAPDKRVVLDGISWSLYQQLLAEAGDGPVRMTFDCGRLEIMSPSPIHESVKKVLARLIEAYSDISKIPVEGLGSTTFDREDLQKGLEPDECYYVAHADDIIGKKTLDLTIDPPPDLAIEVDISPPGVARQPIYGALGVPEIWRFDGRRVQFLRRNPDGRYSPVDFSLSFPKVACELVNELLTVGLTRGQTAAVAELRRQSAGR
jgi:Uma2 family endonuclease